MFPLDLPSFPYQTLLLAIFLSTVLADNTKSPPSPHSDPAQIQSMLAWAISHGAHLHPALAFRDGGFYADLSPINPNEIIASVPTSLEYPLNNRTLDEVRLGKEGWSEANSNTTHNTSTYHIIVSCRFAPPAALSSHIPPTTNH